MRSLRPGVYAPTVIFFDRQTEELDLACIKKHCYRLARAGLAGLVANGSNGEAVHLTANERSAVTRATREALDAAGFTSTPVIVGVSEQSVKATLQLCQDAATDGGDFVLLMAPSFYKWAMTPKTLYNFFDKVADSSPLPVIVYNYPGAASGIDLDSDFLIKLLQHRNIVGVKFTCGNVGKLARVARAVANPSIISPAQASRVRLFAGMADFLMPALSVGAVGVIAGGANVLPRSCVRVQTLFEQGKWEDAKKAQQEVSEADWILTKPNFPGAKVVLDHYFGYGGRPRLPVLLPSSTECDEILRDLKPMMETELALPDAVTS
jgi:L-threo-3-deoxy-hexylosonate aldolase